MNAKLLTVALALLVMVPAAQAQGGTPVPAKPPATASTRTPAEQAAFARGHALMAEFLALKVERLWNTFTPDVQPSLLATAHDVENRDEGVLLIDSRAPERYRGDIEPLDKKAGHIPGAVNRPFSAALGEQGQFRAGTEQAERLAAGDAPTITYCGSGVSAAPNLLARELAGVPLGPDNRLYAGSWSDWVSDEGRPVATGE